MNNLMVNGYKIIVAQPIRTCRYYYGVTRSKVGKRMQKVKKITGVVNLLPNGQVIISHQDRTITVNPATHMKLLETLNT